MSTSSSSPVHQDDRDGARLIDTPEFIDRLAEELRLSGDADLPHSYYVEEVKRRLAGHELSKFDAANDARRIIRGEKAAAVPTSVFQSWAMPETNAS